MHQGEVAPTVTVLFSSPLLSLCLCSSLSSPFYYTLPSTEGLYQLGGPRCAPQSSIEGLEDTEVGSLRPTFIFCVFMSSQDQVEVPGYLSCYATSLHSQNDAFIPSLPLSFKCLFFSSLTELSCRGNVKPMCCCWWCMGGTSWTQQAETPAQRLVMWPPWPQCWRKWRGRISRLLQNMWWSSWCHVRLCVLKPSPWCQSECGCQSRDSHRSLLHLSLKVIHIWIKP